MSNAPLTIADAFKAKEKSLAKLLPPGFNDEEKKRWLNIAWLATKDPKLRDCDPQSILDECFDCAQLGLELTPALGHAYLLPFKEKGVPKAKLITGYKGSVKMLWDAMPGTVVNSDVVTAGDVFTFRKGTAPMIEHEPSEDPDRQKQDVRGSYAFAQPPGAVHPVVEFLSYQQLMTIKARSKGAKSSSSSWNHPIDCWWMYRKSAIIRVAKQLPLSTIAQKQIAKEEILEGGGDLPAREPEFEVKDESPPTDLDGALEADECEFCSAGPREAHHAECPGGF